MSALKVGVSLPTLGGVEALGTGGIQAAARHIEDLGLESVWAPDLIIGNGESSLEVIVTLATAAAVTERVGIGSGVFVLPLRPVAWVAAQAATLQHVSGSRVLLGVGTGGMPGTPFWQAVGGPARERGRQTDSALEALPQLVAGKTTQIDPDKPDLALGLAAAVPPILVGGNSDAAIRRTVAYGDGWLPSLIAPATLAPRTAKLRDLAAEDGRTAPGITVGGHAMLGDDESAHSARETFLRSLVEDRGMSPEEAATIPITGNPTQVAEHLAAYAEAGAERIVLNLDGEKWMRQGELLAEAQSLMS